MTCGPRGSGFCKAASRGDSHGGGGEGQAGQGHPWQARDLRAEPEGSAGQCGRERLHHALPPAMSFVPRGKKHQLVEEAGKAGIVLSWHLPRCTFCAVKAPRWSKPARNRRRAHHLTTMQMRSEAQVGKGWPRPAAS